MLKNSLFNMTLPQAIREIKNGFTVTHGNGYSEFRDQNGRGIRVNDDDTREIIVYKFRRYPESSFVQDLLYDVKHNWIDETRFWTNLEDWLSEVTFFKTTVREVESAMLAAHNVTSMREYAFRLAISKATTRSIQFLPDLNRQSVLQRIEALDKIALAAVRIANMTWAQQAALVEMLKHRDAQCPDSLCHATDLDHDIAQELKELLDLFAQTTMLPSLELGPSKAKTEA